jgi:hypothetical protein
MTGGYDDNFPRSAVQSAKATQRVVETAKADGRWPTS